MTAPVTAHSVLAVLSNLHDGELKLPFTPCRCWYDPDLPPAPFAQVTPTQIVVHRGIRDRTPTEGTTP